MKHIAEQFLLPLRALPLEKLVHTARLLGQRGGLSTSPAKQNAARRNGKKGGRPTSKVKNVYEQTPKNDTETQAD